MKNEFNLSTASKGKLFIYKLLAFLNRFAGWIELVLSFIIVDWLYKVQFAGEWYGFLIYIIPIFLLYKNIKYELKNMRSKGIMDNFILNKRVLLVEGAQGCGKSSFTYQLMARCKGNKYTNSPVKINDKFTYQVDSKILNIDNKIPDYSAIAIDEASLFYHNILSQKNKGLLVDIYAQEILTQLVRHFFDGNIFYMCVDTTRLPKVIEENASSKIQMLEQHNVKVSYIVSPLIILFARLFGIKLRNGLRCWSIQEFRKVSSDNYVVDLGNQVIDTNQKNYANLIEICLFDNPYKVSYNDRFMRGLYEELPEHNNELWTSFAFNRELLTNIGYGEIVKFFDSKKAVENVDNSK